MWEAGGESEIEIFEYNTNVVTFLQNLAKFTNSLKNNTNSPEITNNIPRCIHIHNIAILDSPPCPNTFSKIHKKENKKQLVTNSHYQSPNPKGDYQNNTSQI